MNATKKATGMAKRQRLLQDAQGIRPCGEALVCNQPVHNRRHFDMTLQIALDIVLHAADLLAKVEVFLFAVQRNKQSICRRRENGNYGC